MGRTAGWKTNEVSRCSKTTLSFLWWTGIRSRYGVQRAGIVGMSGKRKGISLDEGDVDDETHTRLFGFILFDPLHPG